ncbi:alpha/beta-hydrolase N-terminal domain-containing protein [Modestobacter versicolor]|uniref:alpha/beta-hydrolase N-terminal domain-containing protein n=1 Tax=Modestobacter versicolor TaxID=429133 RepID=UPI0034DDF302
MTSPRTVELRVHGVSGTPPGAVLGAPVTVQVAGDSLGRFLRPASGAGRPLPAADGQEVEAYHWGLFTSGSLTQALWFLLLPFGLVNAAFFMLPAGPPRWARTLAAAVLRVLGLTLTAVFVLGVVHVLVDALAWQGPGDGDPVWLGLAALGCLAVLGTVTLLGRHRLPPPPPGQDGALPAPDDDAVRRLTRLAERQFYVREPDAPLLRRLHLAAGGLVVALPFADMRRDGPGAVTVWTVGLALAGCALAVALLHDSRGEVRRLLGTRGPLPPSEDVGAASRAWEVLTAVLLAVSGLAVAVAVVRALRDTPPQRGLLPGLSGFTFVLLLCGLVALVVLFCLVETLARAARRAAEAVEADSPDGVPAPFRPYAGGTAAWVVATLAVFVGIGFSVGLSYATSWLLGRLGERVTLPEVHERVAYSWGVAACLVLLLAGAAACWRWLAAGAIRTEVRADFGVPPAGPGPVPQLVDPAVRGTWLGRLKEQVGWVGALFAAVGALLSLGVAAEFRPGRGASDVVPPPLGWLSERADDGAGPVLVPVGIVLLSVFAAGLLRAGRGALFSADRRRVLNVVWDVVAFWPRETHPIAPPPYSQRAVRDLADRVTWHLRHGADRVLLAGHSQGSLICVAALLRVPAELHGRIALVTHGSQLRHSYARAFPGYVNAPLLRWVLGRLDDRWVSLYRDTDPIGGPVLAWGRQPTAEAPTGSVGWSTRLTSTGLRTADDVPGPLGERRSGREWRLLDPAPVDPQLRPWPGARGHGDHQLDPVWPLAVQEVWDP